MEIPRRCDEAAFRDNALSNTAAKPTTFVFTDRTFDAKSGTLTLGYAYPGLCEFVETINFGPSTRELTNRENMALENAFQALHLAAGVSYYKAFVPEKIEINSGPLDDATADFFEHLYFEGLGEFAYRNQIKLKNRIRFPRGGTKPDSGESETKDRTLVPVGGGKDSLVSVEVLRASGANITLAAVNRAQPIVACIDASGLAALYITRTLDKQLLELNDQGALNGHVPITAIVSFILVAAAILHGFDAIAFSNERSADEGNVQWEGRMVNHQFSKSRPFELALAAFVKSHIAKTLEYFSLLRPLSELHIAKLFAGGTRYDAVFTSCNKSYRINDAMTDRRWCCDCPKCRFVFLVLAPFVEKSRLVEIFGKNMLDDASQIEGYRELLGLEGHKPWECVGEILESGAAFWALSEHPDWKDAAIIKTLAADMVEGGVQLGHAFDDAMTPFSVDNLPPDFKEALIDAIES